MISPTFPGSTARLYSAIAAGSWLFACAAPGAGSADPPPVSDGLDRVAMLREELAQVTEACAAARETGQPGQLFVLLRKKWRLMQQLFEIESKLRLVPASSERTDVPQE